MKVIRVENYEQVSENAAELVLREWQANRKIVLGLATGATPVGFYRQLIERHREEQLDFSQITTFNLDEYYPIARNHQQSFYMFMQEHFFRHVTIDPARIHILSGEAADVEAECSSFEHRIAATGGIDVQILGIGQNGHIGFNEPGTPFRSITHKVILTDNTIQANAHFFAEAAEVPRHALTMGIETIMRSKKIVLLASGKAKAKAVQQALHGSVTEEVPASVLQNHPDVTFILDREAAAIIGGESPYAPTGDSCWIEDNRR